MRVVLRQVRLLKYKNSVSIIIITLVSKLNSFRIVFKVFQLGQSKTILKISVLL